MHKKLIDKIIIQVAVEAKILMEVPDELLFTFGELLIERMMNTTNARHLQWRDIKQNPCQLKVILLSDNQEISIGVPTSDTEYWMPLTVLGMPYEQ